MELDKFDFSILVHLQRNAKISNVTLAEKVGLSPSACSPRLNRLETQGIIENYQAIISNQALGQAITSIVRITLDNQSERTLQNFEKTIASCPHIVACLLLPVF